MLELNNKQKNTIELIEEFFLNKKYNYFYLFGYAGTGKTYLIARVVQKLLQDNIFDHIFVCASTHKALNVISSTFKVIFSEIQKEGANVDISKLTFVTLQKLLEYKAIINIDDGKKVFKSISESRVLKKLEKKLIIVDECSMIAESMVNDLEKQSSMYGIKIIYLGDKAQLPPVQEKDSVIFTKIPPDYDYHVILTKIMRTKEPDIKDVCKIIRQWDIKEKLGEKLIEVHNRKGAFKLFHQKRDYINATWFKTVIKLIKNDKSPIILTWKVNTSIAYNNAIRKVLYAEKNKNISNVISLQSDPNVSSLRGDPNVSSFQDDPNVSSFQDSIDLDNFMVGDLIIFNDFYGSPFDGSVFYTSDIAKIRQIKTDRKNLFIWASHVFQEPSSDIENAYNVLLLKLDKIPLCFLVDTLIIEKIHSDICEIDNKILHQIYAINHSHLTKYEEAQENIRAHIEIFHKKWKVDKYSTAIWNLFHKNIKDKYANIVFGYSMTTHKSQASTFSEVFVDSTNIFENHNIDEMKKCLYTAVSRASNELYFII